ncbi:LLM class flavin-dependent oxidoreductase [Pseudonocardia sp. K10HN5]|uniref:LLM class flavin-dependent oxidoreductase n=2 Tax=Pseudonocardia acidicola TaxID=2724939 RepID=A0ABX1S8Y7_9PSEU|nr:LLM class flavin-dependent oxidoreductase [Pseudonocardia acidicola]
MEIGLYGFGEALPDPATGVATSSHRRMAEILEEVELAEQVGLDVFGVGEHHRPEMFVANPAVVLAAAAARTRRIRLTSAVSVLGSADPVRLFQDFALLDVLSNGRAEVMAGRGAFVESFPLFGREVQDSDALFVENIELLLRLREDPPVTWSGRFRPALDAVAVHPRPVQPRLPVWIGVGGTPSSALRAGHLGLPMALALIGGRPEHGLAPLTAHREGARQAGFGPLPVGINTHGLVAPTSQAAADEFFPHYAGYLNTYFGERGMPPLTRERFDGSIADHGVLVVGSPAQVVETILRHHELFGHDRYLMQTSIGSVPHRLVMRSIELFGTEVVPAVRAELRRPGREVERTPSAH